MQSRRKLCLIAAIVIVIIPGSVLAGDWPMWRYDANRSGTSPDDLPAKLYPHWVREYMPLKPAWPDQDKMQFDIVREPVVEGQTLYINSSRYDAVRALDTQTGAEKWTFFADGPVRFAPVAWEGKVYFSSDDGYLYCLQGDTGKLLWKFRGGPSDRKILGNERLISTWPARGAPVITDGKVYFAASIWPFMGTFIHAVDARTGAAVWTNDGDGSTYMKQPHNTDSFAGVAPQGPLVAIGNRLIIPGGRSVPAAFDRRTGKMIRFQLAENGKRGGGSEVAAINNIFFNGGAVFETASEKYLADYGKHIALTKTHAFAWNKEVCKVFDLKNSKELEAETTDAKGKKTKVKKWVMPEVASTKLPGVETMIKAGARLYFGGQDRVTVLDWDADARKLSPSWTLKVEGMVVRLIAADDRLFVITRGGRIYCFGGQEIKTVQHVRSKTEDFPKIASAIVAKAEQILTAAKTRAGYAVVWGVGDGQLVEALAKKSQLHLIVVEPSADKVLAFRERWTKANIYGTRIALIPGDVDSVQLPPYLANLMVCENADNFDSTQLARAYQSVRPYGGTCCFAATPRVQKLLAALAEPKLANARISNRENLVVLVREGALPGSANWTHENADAANTRVSKDVLVKAPMGVLWFGGPSHDGILPRHGHGPQPQVIDGRMIIEGVDLMRALDIYTGRLLWETKLPGVGFFYNNVAHQPGANGSGSNFVSTSDGIYVAFHGKCIRLDLTTGKKIGEFVLPKFPGMKDNVPLGYINVSGDFLIAGADPLFNPKAVPPAPKVGDTSGDDKDPPDKKDDEPNPKKESTITKLFKTIKGYSDNLSASRHLVVMDRKTGAVLWTASAKHSFRHNATCIGGGRLYTIDRLSGEQLARIKKDDPDPAPARLIAFDLKTGKEVWSSSTEVFGTWLSYSEKHDVLVEAGRVARDSLFDEPKGMRAYRAGDGKALWFQKAYTGPAMIHGDTILQDQSACDLLTGNQKMRTDPITGEQVPWKWIRNYGCNTPAASEHLLTFRSGAAGYFDLCNDGGTGNFGGFRSSCTNNLIVAGGIITAPEYTRTCTCAYQNQSSIALIHMPEAEMWTSFGTKDVKGYVKRLGVNLGAAGDRKAENGTLWLEHPSVAGISPAVPIATKPATAEPYRRHSTAIMGDYNWVTSSGLKGVSEVSITLGAMPSAMPYTVKLYFAEPDNLPAGKRVFHVDLEGKRVLSDFDIAKEAGGPGKTLIKEFKRVSAQGNIVVRLTPTAQAQVRQTILCGIEVILEEKK
ncbi:MAG: PQQ-binding-like beta-propeller repeat protein [Planctomycetes bacterium]|nr:PQQ-binding-like beta-propeller repeat protein [Planctomycetota bacterium]